MGCDGGTIPKRHELVKTKQRPEAKDKTSNRAALWTLCSLSSQLLKDPIVACQLGRLYNKVSLIEYLLDQAKSNPLEKMSHIKGLRNVSTLKFTKNPSWSEQVKKGDGYHDMNVSRFVCPITGLEMNGIYKFCFLLRCKCVLSDKALKEIKGNTCPVCGEEYEKENDVVIINPNEDDEKIQLQNMKKRKETSKKSRKENPTEKLMNQKIEKKTKIETKQKLIKPKRKIEMTTQSEQEPNETIKSLYTSHSSAKRSRDEISCWDHHRYKFTQSS